MFQNRRTVFLFVCTIVFIQALYYIVTLQIKKNDPNFISPSLLSISTLIYNQSSDKNTSTVQQTKLSLIQVGQMNSFSLEETMKQENIFSFLYANL
jgi:hypothetical protein